MVTRKRKRKMLAKTRRVNRNLGKSTKLKSLQKLNAIWGSLLGQDTWVYTMKSWKFAFSARTGLWEKRFSVYDVLSEEIKNTLVFFLFILILGYRNNYNFFEQSVPIWTEVTTCQIHLDPPCVDLGILMVDCDVRQQTFSVVNTGTFFRIINKLSIKVSL